VGNNGSSRKSSHGACPKELKFRLGGAEVGIGTRMKYLGLTLDSHWIFEAHLERLASSVEATANERRRTFAASAGRAERGSAYESAIWARELMDRRRSVQLVRRLHRTVAIRVVRGFRTISAVAMVVLAGVPPFELQALRYHEIYLRTRGWPKGGVGRRGADIRTRARQALLDV
jgi:hypothetical protein